MMLSSLCTLVSCIGKLLMFLRCVGPRVAIHFGRLRAGWFGLVLSRIVVCAAVHIQFHEL